MSAPLEEAVLDCEVGVTKLPHVREEGNFTLELVVRSGRFAINAYVLDGLREWPVLDTADAEKARIRWEGIVGREARTEPEREGR